MSIPHLGPKKKISPLLLSFIIFFHIYLYTYYYFLFFFFLFHFINITPICEYVYDRYPSNPQFQMPLIPQRPRSERAHHSKLSSLLSPLRHPSVDTTAHSQNYTHTCVNMYTYVYLEYYWRASEYNTTVMIQIIYNIRHATKSRDCGNEKITTVPTSILSLPLQWRLSNDV